MTTITCQPFGCLSDGREAVCYTLTNAAGASVQLTNYGASVVSIRVPDRGGKLVDVALGCANAADYEAQTVHLGAVPGRHANRIANSRFVLNGTTYHLTPSNDACQLHGGPGGFGLQLWKHQIVGDRVVFTLLSPDGDQGFPGNLIASVAYGFDDGCRLAISYRALCDADTVVNLTNHTYFNLSGHDSGSILDQNLCLRADAFTENGPTSMPTGRLIPVEGTPFDFRTPKPIGRDIGLEDPNLKIGCGYDHNFVLSHQPQPEAMPFATAWSDTTGIQLEAATTEPGVQLYTGNFLADCPIRGKDGAHYPNRSGFCLETQRWPNAMEHPEFPTVVLRAGEVYRQETWFRFGLH